MVENFITITSAADTAPFISSRPSVLVRTCAAHDSIIPAAIKKLVRRLDRTCKLGETELQYPSTFLLPIHLGYLILPTIISLNTSP